MSASLKPLHLSPHRNQLLRTLKGHPQHLADVADGNPLRGKIAGQVGRLLAGGGVDRDSDLHAYGPTERNR